MATDIKGLARSHNISAKKSLGQHFVTDTEVIREIVQLARVQPGDRVLEVGPGLGSLTLGLAQAGVEVVAVELDRSFEPALTEVLGGFIDSGQVRLIWADIMTADLRELAPLEHNWKLVANLPYNIATSLTLKTLEAAPWVTQLTVMLQLEVGQRLAADAGDSTYGIPSVKRAFWADAELLMEVPPEAFQPPPKVNSAVVQLVRHQRSYPTDYAKLFALVERGFRQRRKMLRNSLAGLVSDAAFDHAGIAPTDRPANLSLDDWIRLTDARQLKPVDPAGD